MVSSVNRLQRDTFSEIDGSQSGEFSCTYQIRYWHSEQSRLEGAKSQEYLTKESFNTFHVEISGDDSMDEVIIQCQDHFIGQVIGGIFLV